MLKIQKLSNYGTATPAVARTALQGAAIIEFFQTSEDKKTTAKQALFELQRHLLKCVEIRDQIEAEISAGLNQIHKEGINLQAAGRVASLPAVIDLQSNAETFLQSAKVSIAQIGELVGAFFEISCQHKFHKLLSWAKSSFGESDTFVKAVEAQESFVQRIVTMRNAVDHPSKKSGGRLETENFGVENSSMGLRLTNPTWGLSGEVPTELLPDLSGIIEDIICLGEEMLIELFHKLKGDQPLVIIEIPVEKRDLSNPRRLIVEVGQIIVNS